MQLRPYQRRTIDCIYDWFSKNNKGHLAVSLPTGSGKSVVIAALIQEALQHWPETKVLMLVSKKELIEQNYEKLKTIWPESPVGIYSASIGTKELNDITFAGIQSIHNKADQIGHIDICIIDECDEISHKQVGTYRKLLANLEKINPALRFIGFSGTPYRMGHGYIHQGDDRLFTDMIEPVTIEELIYKGYLSKLQSKHMKTTFDTKNVHKRGGEFVANELEVMALQYINEVVQETINIAFHCKSILVFASSIKHAQELTDSFNLIGFNAFCLTGKTHPVERTNAIQKYKNKEIRVLIGVNVFSVGFDAPDTDCLVLARPTLSPRIYCQQVGRGLRVKSHTDHCLVLDFGGVVATHGPITNIIPPSKAGKGEGEAPIKVCDNCHEIVAISCKVCPACLTPFPEPEEKKLKLRNDDIMGLNALDMEVSSWNWSKHLSKASGKEMLRVSYYGSLSDPPITEYFAITHEGFAGNKARRLLVEIANQAKAKIIEGTMEELAQEMNVGKAPKMIEYCKSGKYNEVVKRIWE